MSIDSFVYFPIIAKEKVSGLKGNGGKKGGRIGNYQTKNSVYDRDGCYKHNVDACDKCPLVAIHKDCDWDYVDECKLRKQKNQGG